MARIINFTRKSQMNGKWASFYIYIDNQPTAKIESGETIRLPLDNNRHSMGVRADMADGKHWSALYTIPEGSQDKYFTIYTKTRLLSIDVLVEED